MRFGKLFAAAMFATPCAVVEAAKFDTSLLNDEGRSSSLSSGNEFVCSFAC